MAGFNELIKNFDRLRDYMRDFFVYGYKTRGDFEQKSSRTYDNERRRIESYLGDYIKWDYGKCGKRISLSVDSSRIVQNPLYRVYRSKSFTDNDIVLHFFLLDMLSNGQALSAGELTEAIFDQYDAFFDVQTVRGKLKEYAGEGILRVEKSGKSLLYGLYEENLETMFPKSREVELFLAFFSEIGPFAVVGYYLSNSLGVPNDYLLFKHHFLVHTLEDNILLTIMEGMLSQRDLQVYNVSTRSHTEQISLGHPVAILISLQTGRRYLVLSSESGIFYRFRLDYIKEVKLLAPNAQAKEIVAKGQNALDHAWGTAISVEDQREHFSMTLFIDERNEGYVLNRLAREGRGGQIKRMGQNQFCYSIEVSDSNELMSWVKTFTGRIISLMGDNQQVIDRFYQDMVRMAKLYGGGE